MAQNNELLESADIQKLVTNVSTKYTHVLDL